MKTDTAKRIIVAPIFWPLFLLGLLCQCVGTFGDWLEDLAEDLRQ